MILENAGLEVFFDYILDADSNSYSDDSDEVLMSFTAYVASRENQKIVLNVFNARKKTVRLVTMTPQKWDGIGLLGLSVKFSEFNAMNEGAHVLMVHDGSPAHNAGLIPMTDYLLGTNLQLFVDVDCVRVHVAEHVDEEITLFVYNSITETIRKTTIIPKNSWGGKGSLGCDLASGYIHRIPLVKATWSFPDSQPVKTEKEEIIDLNLMHESYLPPSLLVNSQIASNTEENGDQDK